MQVKTKKWANETFGIELIAENEEDRAIIKRFDEGGIHNNGVTNTDQKIQLTFKDLMA